MRVSGADLTGLVRRLFQRDLAPRHAYYLPFRNDAGDLLDEGIALYFRAPHSYTGEDVLELQGHGGPAVLRRVLEHCLAAGRDLGIRLADRDLAAVLVRGAALLDVPAALRPGSGCFLVVVPNGEHRERITESAELAPAS